MRNLLQDRYKAEDMSALERARRVERTEGIDSDDAIARGQLH